MGDAKLSPRFRDTKTSEYDVEHCGSNSQGLETPMYYVLLFRYILGLLDTNSTHTWHQETRPIRKTDI